MDIVNNIFLIQNLKLDEFQCFNVAPGNCRSTPGVSPRVQVPLVWNH